MRTEYKFCLYGQSESGKTCLLATVAMGAIGHAGGLTAERLPVTVPKPLGSGKKNRAERDALALHQGKEWIDEAVKRLEEGGIPKGTPPDDLDREVDFKLGSPGRGDVYLRMIDYAGELIDPEIESSRGGASEKLKRHLEKSDGFLILVETPTGGDKSQISEKVKDAIRPLREAFSSLNNKKDMIGVPIAVALTKWDRLSRIDFDNPTKEKEKLQAFLSGNEQLESLARTIANTMEEQSADLSAAIQIGVPVGNCMVFPVSAFGLSERREEGGLKKELPIKGLVRPFNILSPLIWLAGRKDQLDAEKFEDNWKKGGGRAWWPNRLIGTKEAVTNCTKFLTRASKLNPSFNRVEKLRTAYQACLIGGLALIFGVAAFLVDSAWGSVSRYQFGKVMQVAKDPDSNENELIAARQWFDSYGTVWRGWYGNSRESATMEADKIKDRLEDLYWNPVKNAKEENERYQNARKYTERFPSGDHLAEAKSIITDRNRNEGQLENDVFLDGLRLAGQAAKTAEDWREISVKAKELPSTIWGTEKQNQDLGKIRSQANITAINIAKDQNFASFIDSYNRQVQAANFDAASKVLRSAEIEPEKLAPFVSRFPKDVLAKVRNEARKATKDKAYGNAYQMLQDGKIALQSMEQWCNQNDKKPQSKEQEDGIRELVNEKTILEESEDIHLYSIVVKRGDVQSCQRYLQDGPVKSMANDVKAFMEYCNKIDNPLEVKVDVKIGWDKNYNPWLSKDYHQIKVQCNRVDELKTPPEITAEPGTLSASLGTFVIRGKKYDDPVDLDITVQSVGYTWVDDAGTGRSTLKISEIDKGHDVSLFCKKWGLNNIARLTVVDGIPQKPGLPAWKAK